MECGEKSQDMVARSERAPQDVSVTGLWVDEENYWTATDHWSFLPSRDRASQEWNADRAVYLPPITGDERALWSDGDTLWVVSESDDKVYSFNFPRYDASLSSLAASPGSIPPSLIDLVGSPGDIAGFSPDRTRYDMGVAHDVGTATIVANTTDSGATISYSHYDVHPDVEGHQVQLEHGLNAVTLTVTAHNGRITREYTVNIGRSVLSKAGWRASKDLNGLVAGRTESPAGIWGDAQTLWISDSPLKIVAYYRDGARDTTREVSP